MKRYFHILISIFFTILILLPSCRKDELVVPTEYDILPFEMNPDSDPIGMYVLNEGNMGSNKASIDFVDFKNALYTQYVCRTQPNRHQRTGRCRQ